MGPKTKGFERDFFRLRYLRIGNLEGKRIEGNSNKVADSCGKACWQMKRNEICVRALHGQCRNARHRFDPPGRNHGNA